jgi:hypothetical protein
MIALAMVLLVALAGCAKPQEAPPPWKTIDAPTLKSIMASGQNIGVFNTMSELECLDHRIPGTQCLSCEEVENSPGTILPPDKERVIVFYCESAGC